MNLRNRDDRNSLFSLFFIAVAVALAILTAAEALEIFQSSDESSRLRQVTLDQIRPDEQTVKNYLRQYRQAAEELSRQNMFVPPPLGPEPPGDCTAILGQAARIGDRWVQVGDRVSDAEVVAVEPTQVVLLWQDEEISRSPKLSETSTNRRSSSSSSNQSSSRSRNSSSSRSRVR